MRSDVATATLQAIGLSGTSNILAQVIQAFRQELPIALNIIQLARFMLITLLTTPPNCLWQEYLERLFPSSTHDKGDEEKQKPGKLDVKNTVSKFVLDMTIGATVNTLLFIALLNILKGSSGSQTVRACRGDFWPLFSAGLKLWPLVSIVLFTLVPSDRRIVVASVVGLFWNIYLSIIAG